MTDNLSNYQILINKLDKFIRRYYTNKIIRGSIYFLTLVIALFLIFNLLESQFYFNKAVRKSIFYSFIVATIFSLGYWVLVPLSKYFQLGKTISRERAALIIGDHFSNVKDKLLNILQLYGQADLNNRNELLFASIDQKSEGIKIVPFKSAINFNKNKKYLKYLIPPALILLIILLASPGTIKSSTNRIINNNVDFEQPAPFHFSIKNEKLEVIQFEDLKLKVQVEGEYLPSDVYIKIDDYQYHLKKESNSDFSYQFNNIQKNIEFQLFSGKVESKNHELSVIPKPVIADFKVGIDYPSYTGQKDETLDNIGDLILLEGSKVKWSFNAQNTDNIDIRFLSSDKLISTEKVAVNSFVYTKRVKKDDVYKLFVNSNRIPIPDSIAYSINVIKDKYPTISMEQIRDTLDDSVIYFVGNATDDYGFSQLSFNYRLIDHNNKEISFNKKKIDYKPSRNISFKYFLDITETELEPGQSIKYYFEVLDNDGINGPKSATTGILEFKKQTEEEFEEEENENEEDIKKSLEDIIKESKKIRNEIKKLREKLLQKKEPEWQDKKELEKLLEKEKELRKLLEEAKKKMDENLKKQNEFKKVDESILEKQEQLQKMFDESLNQEQKDLMEKIQELMEELNKDEMLDKMDQMSMDEEEVEKQMDRMLELFKTLEVEKEMQESIDKLNELAEKQEKLSEETKNGSKPEEELKKEQEELNKEFEKTKEKVEELTKKNKELERPKDLAEDNEEKMEEIQEDMEKSEEQLKDSKPQDASQSQKGAAQKMKSMANSLQMQMNGSSKEQHEEDIKALRQLLENILTLSFDQEVLMDNADGVIVNSPAYKQVLKDQYIVKEDFKIVEDSLQALSKRVAEIETFVVDKVAEIKTSLKSSLSKLEDDYIDPKTNQAYPGRRDFPGAIKAQHESMKGLNDLALMLDESMQQMQQNAAGMPGGGSCDKPGGKGKKPGKKGNVPMDKIAEGQKSLTEKMKSMMKGLKGENGEGKGMPKKFAEAAKRQAELRKALEEIKKQKQEEGKGAGNDLQKMIDEMNKIEEDLVNKKLDAQLIKRQQDISSRLLEADKADRKRGFDNQRKSKSAVEKEKKMPPAIEKYLKERESQLETYKSISPSLKPFYRKLVDDYIKNLKQNK